MSAERTRRLFAAHGRFVFAVVRRLGAPARDAEDLTQEVFMVAHRQIARFDGAHPKAWLFRIASRVVKDYRGRASNQRERLDESQEPPGDAPAQEGRVWCSQLRSALDAALDHLTDDERAVFLLYELEEMPMSECAAILAIPEQTGYSRLKAARKKLRRHLSRKVPMARMIGGAP